MKRLFIQNFAVLYAIALLPLVYGCKSDTKQSDLFAVDVEGKYPVKEVHFQDIAEVKYIALETSDEVLCTGIGRVKYIDKDYIVFVNDGTDGNIFIFDGSGKIISRINKKGQGPEEYLHTNGVVFDKEKQEVYVSDLADRIFVYDISGKFKRKLSLSFKETDNVNVGYNAIYNFDKDHLLYYGDIFSEEHDSYAYSFSKLFLVSKQNGEIMKEVSIYGDLPFLDIMDTDVENFLMSMSVVLKQDNHIHINFAQKDTLYRVAPDFTLEPFIKLVPSVQKKDITLIFNAETANYRFMTLAKNVSEFSIRTLCLDKQFGTISELLCYNRDDKDKTPIKFVTAKNDVQIDFIRPADDNQYYLLLQPFDLKEANKNGKLQGELQDIATKIGEDDNPVLMTVKFK